MQVQEYGMSHFESAHSWLGMFAASLYLANAFAAPLVSLSMTDTEAVLSGRVAFSSSTD